MNTPASPSSFRAALVAWITPVKVSLLAASFGLGALNSSEAAVIPYTNDFSGTGSNVAFPNQTTSANSTWTVSEGSYVYSSTNTSWPVGNASIPLTNMGTSPFVVETQFTVSSVGAFNSNGVTVGLGLFGSDAAFTGLGLGNSYYLADWTLATTSTGVTPGQFRLIALGDTSGYTSTSTVIDTNPDATIAVTLGATYTMRLVGSYSGSTLNMTFSLLNSTGNVLGTVTASDTSPLTGTNFGYRNRSGLSGGAFTTSFDGYSVTATAVPEPGTVALLGLGLGATLLMMRRRQA
jgi:hypothetical protein